MCNRHNRLINRNENIHRLLWSGIGDASMFEYGQIASSATLSLFECDAGVVWHDHSLFYITEEPFRFA